MSSMTVAHKILLRASSRNVSAKAVAEGAAICRIQRLVMAPALRFAYGIAAEPLYDPSNKLHSGRIVNQAPGGTRISGVWEEIAPAVLLFYKRFHNQSSLQLASLSGESNRS